jgi:multidrug efflux pump subunit AcrB
MRSIFSILGLLIVLAVVGMLAKKQLGSLAGSAPKAPAESGVTLPTAAPGASPQQQSQQIQQQIKQSVDAALQQPRPMPEEK